MSGLTNQDVRDLRTVLRLIVDLAPEDLDRGERAAFRRLAGRVDKVINRQTGFSPFLPDWPYSVRHPACTYSLDHPKTCPCRGEGYALEPVGGWSRLASEVT